eukprot:Phypoly_transcript_06471.p1 GENE.Phypoly_transcript_06471~~Phypoly_transcript_06471.p1  ORF type:complete len:578 (+),score=148.43 Phypoly_transcript_06471:27-1736(+)
MRLVILCICSFLIFQVVSGSIIRGVSPYELQFYKEDPFKCRNEPTRIIPRSSINDNYCDCADGSDEPGTSACANGMFYCVNKGYKGESIFSSQVNDGICDCCDGSDESEGKVKCTNDCEAKGVELRKQREAEKEKIQKGLQIKEQWIADAAKTLAEKRESIDGLKAEVEKLKKVVEDLEAEKRGFEEKEKAEQDVINERKKELERIEQERLQKEAPPTPPENEQQEQEALKQLLENKGEENKETSEEAKEPAEEPAEQHDEESQPPQPATYDETPSPPPSPTPDSSSPDSTSPTPTPTTPSPPSPPSHIPSPRGPHSSKSRSRFGRNARPGPPGHEESRPPATPQQPPQPEEETELLKTIREGNKEAIDQQQEPTIINKLFQTYESFKNWLVPVLQSYHILSTEEEKQLAFYTEGKRKIEDELSQVRRDLSTAESNLRSTEEILSRDFGPNNEFFALNGNCYEHKTREYTYTVCPFGDVKQAHTSLGKFEKWDPAYTVMSFTEGQQCWGGPKRSAKVTLLCGAENELHDIQEPNKCEYAMKLNTPAACTAAPLELLNLGGEGEAEHGSH